MATYPGGAARQTSPISLGGRCSLRPPESQWAAPCRPSALASLRDYWRRFIAVAFGFKNSGFGSISFVKSSFKSFGIKLVSSTLCICPCHSYFSKMTNETLNKWQMTNVFNNETWKQLKMNGGARGLQHPGGAAHPDPSNIHGSLGVCCRFWNSHQVFWMFIGHLELDLIPSQYFEMIFSQ